MHDDVERGPRNAQTEPATQNSAALAAMSPSPPPLIASACNSFQKNCKCQFEDRCGFKNLDRTGKELPKQKATAKPTGQAKKKEAKSNYPRRLDTRTAAKQLAVPCKFYSTEAGGVKGKLCEFCIDRYASPRVVPVIQHDPHFKVFVTGIAGGALHRQLQPNLHLSTRLCGSLTQDQILTCVHQIHLEFAKGGTILAALYQLLVMLPPTTRSQLALTGFMKMPNVSVSTDLLSDCWLSVSDVDVMAAVIAGKLSQKQLIALILMELISRLNVCRIPMLPLSDLLSATLQTMCSAK